MSWPLLSEWNQVPKSRIYRAHSDINALQVAVEQYRRDHGVFPTTLRDIVIKPDGEGYISRFPLDPWNKPYVYMVEQSAGGPVVRLSITPDQKTRDKMGVVEITNDPGDGWYKRRCSFLDKIGLERGPCVETPS